VPRAEEKVLSNLWDGQDIIGLTTDEAARRLQADGPNELPSAKPRGLLTIALEVIREPMFLLLLAGGGIYLILGDLQEALLLLGFVFVIIGITLHQERKTENALKALQNLSSPRARVIRGGEDQRIAGRDVVRGDIVVVAEGDRIPADGVVLSSSNLTVDESLLTGESVPVRKVNWDRQSINQRPGGDDEPFVFSGTLVVQGQALLEIQHTGIHTEIGKIGKSLQALEPEKTALQRQTARLVRTMAIAGGILSVVVALAYGVLRGDWLHGVLAGVALAMSLLPEEFPVVLTIFLALGAWRISRQRVLARRMHAVEILGSATVLCVDKTGTLTLNQMTVGALGTDDELVLAATADLATLPNAYHLLVEYSILASQRDPFDPMERALHQYGNQYLAQTEHIHQDWTLVQQYPLSPELLAMSHVWRSPGGHDYSIAAKGAPESIADLCHFTDAQRQALSGQIARMAGQGFRVIGVAQALFTDGERLPRMQHDFDFQFLGFIGLIDPVRPSVPAAIRECTTAGIRVVMITGDYPVTARNIATQIGLPHPERVITGDELTAMEQAVLQERIRDVNVFARVVPEQKLRLVQALKANGDVVAMTGDGVNDAPALKAADIGVAMGGRGTDVAREAAGLVVLDDDFASIVAAIRLGRRIFDNLRKAMAYIFAVHVPIAGLSLIPVLLGWPLILLPIHIVLMELVIDPACSTVFEAEEEEANTMTRPPRSADESVFNGPTVMWSFIQGACVLATSLAVFAISRQLTQQDDVARTMAFTTLMVGNVALILTNLSWTRSLLATIQLPNSPLWWVVSGVFLLVGAMLYVPLLSDLLRFSRLSVPWVGVCIVAGLVSVLWFEGVKWWRIQRNSSLGVSRSG
jgi:Ca2+-transporting ATPase